MSYSRRPLIVPVMFAFLLAVSANAERPFFVQTTPGLTLCAPAEDPANPRPDDYRRYYSLPPFIAGGLDLRSSGLELVLRLDIRGDFLGFLNSPAVANIPFLVEPISAIGDVNMPSVGYIGWNNSAIGVSVGRRKLGWGPAHHGMAISSDAAYMDHFWFDGRFPVKNSEFWFNYVLVGTDRAGESSAAEAGRKVIVAHKLGWENDFFRVSVGELNIVHGTTPEIQDIAPLVSWHNLYQDANSNVMLEAAAEAARDGIRGYGEFIMDDLVMPWESSSGRPNAMAWVLGFSWNPVPGKAFAAPAFGEIDYGLHERTFAAQGGLNVTFEHYRATTYVYNRENNAGKWVLPDHRLVNDSSGYLDSDIAAYFGFPYGPDCALERLAVSWENAVLRVALEAGYLRKGAYTIDSPYSPGSNALDWYALVEPVKGLFLVNLDAAYLVSPCLRVDLSARGGFGSRNASSLVLGCTWFLASR